MEGGASAFVENEVGQYFASGTLAVTVAGAWGQQMEMGEPIKRMRETSFLLYPV